MVISAASLAPFAGMLRQSAPLPAAQPSPEGSEGAALSKKAEREAQKLQQARDAVETLKAVKRDSRDDIKARAKQKVEELKNRLRSLRMLYAGNPKKLAHLAAQIARELGAAVKNYLSAGGAAADVGGGSPAVGPSEQSGVQGSAPEAPAAAEDATEAKESQTATDPFAKPVDKGSPQDRLDADFAREARQLARELKALLRRRDQHPDGDQDRASAESAVNEVEFALDAMPVGSSGAGVGMIVTI